MDKIKEICQANIPKKGIQYCSSGRISRERKNCSIGSGCLREINIEHIVKRKKMIIEKKIAETERELKESGIKEKMENERRAIDSMQEYPKMFYTYVNNQKNRRREIGPLKNSKGERVYDG